MRLDKTKGNEAKSDSSEISNLDLDLDLDLDDEDSKEEVKEVSKPTKQRPAIVREQKSSDSSSNFVKVGIGSIAVVAVVVGIILITSNTKKEEKIPVMSSTQTLTDEVKEPVTAGSPNLQVDNNFVNSTTPVEGTILVKDLNGKAIDTDFTVRFIQTRSDYINYEKKRAVMGDGIEFYWLEAIYLDKPYKVQVSFKVFKELRPKGIIKVKLEVLTLESGSEIVSYMEVDEGAR